MLCNEQGLDGIDFDWEGVDFQKNRDLLTAYVQLLVQAKKQFKKHGKIVSLAMHTGQEKYMIDQKMADAVDRFHLMAYDECASVPCQHSTLKGITGHLYSLKQMLQRYNASPQKIVMGIPAYARHETQPEQVLTYSEICQQNPELDPKLDRVAVDGGGVTGSITGKKPLGLKSASPGDKR